MRKTYNVAVVGATGNVGREMLRLLSQREFPVNEVVALSSKRSEGKKISFGDQTLTAKSLENFDFSHTDIVLSSAGAEVSQSFARRAAQHAVVIDNTSHFRMDPTVPLVIPEINPDHLNNMGIGNIIANPNCSTITMLMALNPLNDVAAIKNIVVSTYQSVSGAGKQAMDELFNSTKSVYMGDAYTPRQFSRAITFNVIPQIDVLPYDDIGQSKEEWKMQVETNKIMDNDVVVSATCVRVPVFIGHGMAINIELETPLSVTDAHRVLDDALGVCLRDDPDNMVFATPKDAAGFDDVFVSRVRPCRIWKHGLSLWAVGDNLRKGAALNAIQIAEKLIHMNIV